MRLVGIRVSIIVKLLSTIVMLMCVQTNNTIKILMAYVHNIVARNSKRGGTVITIELISLAKVKSMGLALIQYLR